MKKGLSSFTGGCRTILMALGLSFLWWLIFLLLMGQDVTFRSFRYMGF